MNGQELSELRVITDSIAAAPERWQHVIDMVIADQKAGAEVNRALEKIRQAAQASSFRQPAAKLLATAEKLVVSDDPLERNAGGALYSALADYGHSIDRERIRAAIGSTRVTRLLERYRAAEELGAKLRQRAR